MHASLSVLLCLISFLLPNVFGKCLVLNLQENIPTNQSIKMLSVHFNRQCKVRNITALTGKWLCSWYLCIIFFDEFKHFCFLFKNQVSKYILLLERLSLDPLISEWTLCMLCNINHKAHKNIMLTNNSYHITLKITGTHMFWFCS